MSMSTARQAIREELATVEAKIREMTDKADRLRTALSALEGSGGKKQKRGGVRKDREELILAEIQESPQTSEDLTRRHPVSSTHQMLRRLEAAKKIYRDGDQWKPVPEGGPPKNGGGRHGGETRKRAEEWLRKHPDEVVTPWDLARRLEANPRTAQTTLDRLIDEKKVKVVSRNENGIPSVQYRPTTIHVGS